MTMNGKIKTSTAVNHHRSGFELGTARKKVWRVAVNKKNARFLFPISSSGGSKDSSVVVVIKLRDGLLRDRGSVLSEAKILSLLQNVQIDWGGGGPQSLLLNAHLVLFLRR